MSNTAIIYLAIHSLWPDFIKSDIKLISSLANSGVSVFAITCDASLPECDLTMSYRSHYGLRNHHTCQTCISNNPFVGKKNLPPNINIVSLSSLIRKSQQNLTLHTLLDKYDINEQHEVMTYCANERLTIATALDQDNINFNLLKRLTASRELIREITTDLILDMTNNSFNVIGGICTHGHRSPSRGFCLALEDKNIPWLSYCRSPHANETDSICFWSNVRDYFNIFSDQSILPLLREIKSKIAPASWSKKISMLNYYPSLVESLAVDSCQPSTMANINTYEEKSFINLRRNFSRCILISPSSESENFGYSTESSLLDQNKLFDHLEELSSLFPDYLFVIREHPYRTPKSSSSLEGEKDYWSVSFDLQSRFSTINNILIVPSHSRLSSYNILSESSLCISLYSSVAVEASLLSIPVVTSISATFSFCTPNHIDMGSNAYYSHDILSDKLKKLIDSIDTLQTLDPLDILDQLYFYHKYISIDGTSLSINHKSVGILISYLKELSSRPNLELSTYMAFHPDRTHRILKGEDQLEPDVTLHTAFSKLCDLRFKDVSSYQPLLEIEPGSKLQNIFHVPFCSSIIIDKLYLDHVRCNQNSKVIFPSFVVIMPNLNFEILQPLFNLDGVTYNYPYSDYTDFIHKGFSQVFDHLYGNQMFTINVTQCLIQVSFADKSLAIEDSKTISVYLNTLFHNES